jgi:hypothetical protein
MRRPHLQPIQDKANPPFYYCQHQELIQANIITKTTANDVLSPRSGAIL